MVFQHFRFLAPPSPKHIHIILAISCLELHLLSFCFFFGRFSTKTYILHHPFPLSECSCPFGPLKKTYKNQWLFNIFTFCPTKPDHTCIVLAISCIEAHLFSFCCFFAAFSTKNCPGSLNHYFLGYSWPPWPFKKTLKNQWFFNISAFGPHQARTYTHHTCHLMSRSSFALLLLPFWSLFRKKTIHSTTFFHSWSVLAPLPPSKKH